MKTRNFLIITGLIWVISLLNGTGLGNTYNTTEYTRYILYAVVMIPVLFKDRHLVNRYVFMTFGGMATIFFISSLVQGYEFVSLDYLTCFMMIAILAKIQVSESAFRITGYAYAALGFIILLIFNFGSTLDGWNTNTIAMAGMMSYMIFAASNFYNEDSRLKIILVAVTLLFLWQIALANSRSCMLTVALMLVMVLFGRKGTKPLSNRFLIIFILTIPLLIAIIVTLLSEYGNLDELESWSLKQFNKTIFNGRDILWSRGFEKLFKNFWFGTGKISGGYWHNNAVTCLTSYGVIGYTLWISCFYIIIRKCQAYTSDPIVAGCITVFLMINIQQAFELGMFSSSPNLLIYLPLGLMLGRIKYLKKQETDLINKKQSRKV